MSNDLMVHDGPLPVMHETGDDSPASLVRFAIERGVDVAVLERLVALQERVAERDARAAFFEAVASFQDECPEIRKAKTAEIVSKKTGGRFSYTYAPLEEVARTIRPVLKKHGLSYSWNVTPAEGALMVTCVLRHVEGHEERADFPVPNEGDGRMSAAQANGAALTYGKRQSLTSVLGLVTADEDKDGARRQREAQTITDAQAADLTSLMDEVNADRARFFQWAGVQAVADLPLSKLAEAIRILEAKRDA